MNKSTQYFVAVACLQDLFIAVVFKHHFFHLHGVAGVLMAFNNA